MKTSTVVLIVGGVAALGIGLLFLSGNSGQGQSSSAGPLPDLSGAFGVPSITSVIPSNIQNTSDNLLTDFQNLVTEVGALAKNLKTLSDQGIAVTKDVNSTASVISQAFKGFSDFGNGFRSAVTTVAGGFGAGITTGAQITSKAYGGASQAYNQVISYWAKLLRGGR